ncbi:MAG: alpha/beta hydrolase fold domain-containing protein [Acidobacteriota bacterium]
MTRRSLVILLFLTAPAFVKAQSLLPTELPTYPISVTEGIVYGTGEVSSPAPRDKELLLDLYEPVGAREATGELSPALVLIHGGGFIGGSRQEGLLVNIAENLAARGWVVVSIEYRLGPDVPIPSARMQTLLEAAAAAIPDNQPVLAQAQVGAVDDTLTAVEWLKSRAGGLGIEPSQIGLLGTSAGAVTAVHTGYLLDDHAIAADPFTFVVDLWGGSIIPADNRPAAARFLEAGEPPLFVVHGTEDPQVDFELAQLLVARADAQGVPYEFHPLAGVGHGVNLFQVELSPGLTLFERMAQWSRSVVQEQRAETRSLAFEVGDISVSEDSATASLRVRRLGTASGGAGVTVETRAGTATSGVDFSPLELDLTWPDGDVEPRTVNVDLIDDGQVEGPETFSLQLSNPTGGAALVSPSTLTVTITDDDQVVPSACAPDDTTSCLLGQRFRVTGVMTDANGNAFTMRVMSFEGQRAETDTTVFFESFIDGAVEFVFKMIDACTLTDTYWGFLSGTLTNQETIFRVEDTATGQVQVYSNPAEQIATGFQDTDFFRTCDG